ncbi:FAD-dependent oxidoreductase [Virgibacillus soli]|uniref:FAD-dependent oxidoreductase n=1 Tax=Paracerasibacillus soli TaxID=480284 RepID=A0ABU5CPI5_9BACI|nr:FAD-dependent oxidoreductase [Virgibacillus soli]MDY0408256.1 FAD-dependent oxidoreductase [Virgibacillus soli]
MKEKSMPQYPESYWLQSTKIPSFPKLDQTIKDIDVGIVGGGITGLTAAYLLAKENKKVALIDAGNFLGGTTGHTTAKVTAQHGVIYDELMQHFGKEKAALYFQAQVDAMEMIKNHCNTLDIFCDLTEQDAYIFATTDDGVHKLEKEAKAYEELGIDGELTNEMPLDISYKIALVMKNQLQYHPVKYLVGLLKECERYGVQFYENTVAVDVEFNKNPAIITREGERIYCRNVIVASHFPFYDGQGFYPTRMYAERSYVLGVKTNMPYPGGMYINAESPSRSVRSVSYKGEDIWLIIGENHKTGQGKDTLAYYEALEQFAEKNFGIKQFLYRWSTQDLITLDKLPYVGNITKAQNNVFVATGYRKWGMTNGTIAAKILTDQILDQENPYSELFTPSRFQADPALKEFTKVNADVAKHLIKGKLEYTKAKLDELQQDEATITRINGKRAGAYRDQEGQVYIVNTTCTHLGCEVEWNEGERTWDCPCHGSRFSYTGEVVEGPAKRPLEKLQ